jgi:hypothetical protein
VAFTLLPRTKKAAEPAADEESQPLQEEAPHRSESGECARRQATVQGDTGASCLPSLISCCYSCYSQQCFLLFVVSSDIRRCNDGVFK